jgi:hypothetical protein
MFEYKTSMNVERLMNIYTPIYLCRINVIHACFTSGNNHKYNDRSIENLCRNILRWIMKLPVLCNYLKISIIFTSNIERTEFCFSIHLDNKIKNKVWEILHERAVTWHATLICINMYTVFVYMFAYVEVVYVYIREKFQLKTDLQNLLMSTADF